MPRSAEELFKNFPFGPSIESMDFDKCYNKIRESQDCYNKIN